MASQDKLLKSLDALEKCLSSSSSTDIGNIKKEKFQHCQIVTDCLSSGAVQSAHNFPNLLSYTMETFFHLCDDPDSDVRMIAEECMNKIIRVMSDENITRVLIELYKEIKRNKSPRSLRVALSRFSKLAHFVRPHKGKPYVLNLFPSLTKIVERPEEAVHETLANTLPRIIEVLGPFATDNDMKIILKSFLGNISNPSAVIRRTTANSILSICLNSRKAIQSIVYCVQIVLGFVFPLNENCDSHLILGVMGLLKILMPHWRKLLKQNKPTYNKFGNEWENLKTEKLIQIYELCLHYASSKDHNFVNASLETLNILLQNATNDFKNALLDETGIMKWKSYLLDRKETVSSSHLNLLSSLPESTESELMESLRPDIAKWIDGSKLSILGESSSQSYELLHKSDSLESNCSAISTRTYPDIYFKVEKLNGQFESSTHLSEKSVSCEDILDSTTKDVFIGQLTDRDVAFKFCARFLAKSFLLTGVPGGLLSDKSTRISVKSSAISCLSSIVKLCPKILHEFLDKNANLSDQRLADILLFSDHHDPQLRGATRILIGNYVVAVLVDNKGKNYVCEIEELNFEKLIKSFLTGLEDQSSSCVRNTLQSLELCLELIMKSEECKTAASLLQKLSNLSENPYWLVKVNLCELISQLPYTTIYYVTNGDNFQKRIISDIIFKLIEDADIRVRTAAIEALLISIPKLEENLSDSVVTAKAIFYRDKLSNLYNSWNGAENFFLPNTLDQIGSPKIEFVLSKIILRLQTKIISTKCKNSIFGGIESLASLSRCYPCTIYRTAWNCNIQTGCINVHTNDLLELCVNFMTSSEFAQEISFHTNLMLLSSNLYGGFSTSILRNPREVTDDKRWQMFESTAFSTLSETYLSHIMKILSIYQHIVDDVVLQSTLLKPIILSLPNASPMKRRKSDLEKKLISPSKNIEDKQERKEKEKNSVGNFSNSPHYMKIYENLKTAYTNYKTSLEAEASEIFLNLLIECLKSFSSLMRIASLSELGNIAEEILAYLGSIFKIEPTATVECVRQLLKCIFGTNLSTVPSEVLEKTEDCPEKHRVDNNVGFYYEIFVKPYNEIERCIDSLNEIDKNELLDGSGTLMGYLHKKRKIPQKNLDKVLASYIRIFEPMVIKSLKQYTITSDVKFQGKVLQLLSQLVELKINYCLLDADQIFINFVINQFEYIIEGQIRNSEELIPRTFQFFVQLSYSKQHSKIIIDTPKIIQLCDELIASGQSPLTHCIPALKPVVQDIFLSRNSSNTQDVQELETTREVILAMLLKLIEHHEVVELIVSVLSDSRYSSDTEKWFRWCQNVFASFIAVLKNHRYKFDNIEAFTASKKLIFALNSNAFRPIDDVLLLLFQEPPALDAGIEDFRKWLGKILTIFLILSSFEEVEILLKMSQLKNNFAPNSVFENVVITSDPLNVTNNSDYFHLLSPETIMVRFIFRTITLAIKKCNCIISEREEDDIFPRQLSTFLVFCVHCFQSGFLSDTAKVAVLIVEKSKYAEECDAVSMELMNENFLNVKFFYPTLTLQWVYFLTLLNYTEKSFWMSVLMFSENSDKRIPSCNSINNEIVKTGGLIAFCDGVCEKSTKNFENITWFLESNVTSLINLMNEPPINEFFSIVHRDLTLSRLLLKSLENHLTVQTTPIYKLKFLKVIENAHPSLTGYSLKLLFRKLIDSSPSLINKEICKLIVHKLEYLQTIPTDMLHNQFSKNDLIQSLSIVNKNITKYAALVSLLNKVGSKYYYLPKQETYVKSIDSATLKKLDIDRKWYLSQVASKVDKAKFGKEIAQMLNVLSYEEQIGLMQGPQFDIRILKDCFKEGVEIYKNNEKTETPEIFRASMKFLQMDIENILRNFKIDDTKVNSKLFHSRIPITYAFLDSLKYIPNLELETNCLENLLNFTLLSLEVVANSLEKNTPSINIIEYTLRSFDSCLKNAELFNIINSYNQISFVSAIYQIVKYLLNIEDLLRKLDDEIIAKINEKFENSATANAVIQLYALFLWLYERKSATSIPVFLLKLLDDIIISMSRLSILNYYMLIPVKVWAFNIPFNSNSPPPVESLQETDVLREYMFRNDLLGWSSRQQFEETWMCLLSVLCNTPSNEVSSDEKNEAYVSIALAIKGITSMLMQTLYHPMPGRKNVSHLLHASRDQKIKCDRISVDKLKQIQRFIKSNFNNSQFFCEKDFNINDLFEEINPEQEYGIHSFSEVSVEYLWIAVGNFQEINVKSLAYEVWKKRQDMLTACGLDVDSCLHFLHDFYTQLLKNQKIEYLILFHQVVRSILTLSDLFNEKSQFNWMLNLFLDLLKIHNVEDELVHQYLIIGVCKCVAVLNSELEVYEIIKKYLVQLLKCNNLPSRIACLHGLLFILEGCKLSNISIGSIPDELQLILPCAVEYIQTNLQVNKPSSQSIEHTILLWTLIFFIVENIDETHFESTFIDNVLNSAILVLTEDKINLTEFQCVSKRMQRLIVIKPKILERVGKKIMKASLSGLKQENPLKALMYMQLLFTYMYIYCADQVEAKNEITTPETYVQTVEKFTTLFEYIKKGYIFEVEVVCSLLPKILDDFFTPADILTKVICEFLSTQQPYQKLLSNVIFHLFQSAIRQDQITLLQDWVVFSLPNFTQNFSYPMATWCLTCFFVSASRNKWLISLFPYIQTRMQRCEKEDKEMLCIAGSDFYRNLSTDSQKNTFRENFKSVRNMPDTPFNDLLSSL